MKKRFQWGLVTSIVFAFTAWIMSILLPGAEPRWAAVIGLAMGGFISGFAYIIPPLNKRKKS
ncbi:hypothetical protein [Halobacillus andaensis]|uniref:hypothetical protein n=1 Tax=Halobacillus andaensis TaxID=1176239 RepID=UPI003D7513F8